MAKEIVVKTEGKSSSFNFSKVSRSKLYGRRQRVAVDPENQPCRSASLTEDGRFLIQSGMTSQGYFDEKNCWIPNSKLVGLDEDGQPLEKVASTLGTAQPLEGPLSPSALADLKVDTVYQLEANDVDPALQEKLDEGKIFRFEFNYRADYRAEIAFLVANTTGTYAVVGQPTESIWCELGEAPPPVVDDEDPFADDLDFEMF